MDALKAKTGIKSGKFVKKFSVTQLVINFMSTRPVKKIFLNFYGRTVPLPDGSQSNEAKRIS